MPLITGRSLTMSYVVCLGLHARAGRKVALQSTASNSLLRGPSWERSTLVRALGPEPAPSSLEPLGWFPACSLARGFCSPKEGTKIFSTEIEVEMPVKVFDSFCFSDAVCACGVYFFFALAFVLLPFFLAPRLAIFFRDFFVATICSLPFSRMFRRCFSAPLFLPLNVKMEAYEKAPKCQ